LSQEEIDKIYEQIPEWKRGAVVVTDQSNVDDDAGLFRRLGRKVKSKFSKT